MPRIETPGIRPAGSAITFLFEGETIPALEGETLAAALTAAGKLDLRHDHKGGARGLYCGMGCCFECVVTVDGRASQRACMTKARDGMRVERQGFLTLPVAADLAPWPEGEAPVRTCDVLVVGGGPAGLAAAKTAATAGASVILVDERPAPGGQYFKQIAPSHAAADPAALDAQFRNGLDLIAEVRALGVDILDEATVWWASADDGLGIYRGGECFVCRAGQVILASGAYERPVPIPGATLPGFMTTGAVQTLLRSYRVSPGRRVLVAGNGPLNLQVAVELVRGGTDVAAVVEEAPFPGLSKMAASIRAFLAAPDLMLDGGRYVLQLMGKRVPLLFGRTLTRVEGEGRVERAFVARLDSEGPERAFDVDIVSAGYGFLSATELARQMGCRHDYVDKGLGNLVAVHDDFGETTVPCVFVAGDGGGILGARVAGAQGILAGFQAARNLGLVPEGDLAASQTLARNLAFQKALWKIYDVPPFRAERIADEALICRCESVTAGRVRALIAEGYDTLGEIKKLTRVGMGRCQGRNCQHLLVKMISAATGKTPDEFDFFHPRPPSKPIPAAALAREKPEWSGFNESFQKAPETRPVSPPPEPWEKPLETDVLIIGAGIIGVSTAYYLSRQGVDVTLVDRGEPNWQASGVNAGSLHVQVISYDIGDPEVIRTSPTAAMLPLGPEAMEMWRSLSEELDVEVKVTGGLIVAETEAQLDYMARKAKIERSLGIDVHIVAASELADLVPCLAEGMAGGAFCPQEGKLNPLSATATLLKAAEKAGTRTWRRTLVKDLEKTPTGFKVITDRGHIQANRVVNAAGAWMANLASCLGVQIPITGAPIQMIVTEPCPPMTDKLLASASRHLTLKQVADGHFVIGGAWTAHFDQATGSSLTLRPSLEGSLRTAGNLIPAIRGLHVIRSWAGIMATLDGAPLLSEVPGAPGFYCVVSNNGYTLGPLLGQLTAELICDGKAHRDLSPYSIERFAG
jgi:D-hydroxyproline dehydrogenase subunit alpha